MMLFLKMDYLKYQRFKVKKKLLNGTKPIKIVLINKSNIGEDNLILFFKITKKADLVVKCFDIKDEFREYTLEISSKLSFPRKPLFIINIFKT